MSAPDDFDYCGLENEVTDGRSLTATVLLFDVHGTPVRVAIRVRAGTRVVEAVEPYHPGAVRWIIEHGGESVRADAREAIDAARDALRTLDVVIPVQAWAFDLRHRGFV